MSRPPPSPPPVPQVRLMFEPSHLALGCLATAYARLVPRRPRSGPGPSSSPAAPDPPCALPATPSPPGGTQP